MSDQAILAGFCCKWGEYNTHSQKKVLYEPPPVQISALPGFLVSFYVKISSLAVAQDYQVYLLDTNKTAAEIISGGIQGVIDAGGKAIAISDDKVVGGVFGYDPPTEELVTVRSYAYAPGGRKDGYREVIEMKGRPFVYGLAVALVLPADNSIYVTAAEAAGSLFVDCRYLHTTIDPVLMPMDVG